MLDSKTVFTLILASFLTISCGGGSDSESDASNTSGFVRKYAGKWKVKNFCGLHPATSGFFHGKYGTVITDIQVISNNAISIHSHEMYFKNPMCSGNGEMIPGHSTTDSELECYNYEGVKNISGKDYDKFNDCDRGGDRTIMRISNGELELSEGHQGVDQDGYPNNNTELTTLFFVKYQ